MKATHWTITVTRSVKFVRAGYVPWQLPAEAKKVYAGNLDVGSYTITSKDAVKRNVIECKKQGLDCKVTPCVLVPLTAQELLDEGLDAPAEEWSQIAAKYAAAWWPEMEVPK